MSEPCCTIHNDLSNSRKLSHVSNSANTLLRFLPVIGLVLFIWAVHNTGIDAIIQSFHGIDWYWLLPVPALLIVYVMSKSLKWKWVLEAYGVKYSFLRCVKVVMVGFFASLITPAKLGDALRATYLKRDTDTQLATGLSSIFIDRIYDVLALTVLIAVSVFLLWHTFSFTLLLPFVIAGVVALLFLACALMSERIMRMLLKPLVWLVPARMREKCRDAFGAFYGAMTEAHHHKRKLFAAFSVNVIAWMATMSYFYILGNAFHMDISVAQIFAIMPVALFIELLPISISGLGTRETALLFLFAQLGIPTTDVVAYSLTYFVISAWPIGIVGLLLWFKDPIQFKQARSVQS